MANSSLKWVILYKCNLCSTTYEHSRRECLSSSPLDIVKDYRSRGKITDEHACGPDTAGASSFAGIMSPGEWKRSLERFAKEQEMMKQIQETQKGLDKRISKW